MSLAALALVVCFVAGFGVVRGTHDEGAAVRFFQFLMVAQIPIVGYFGLMWLPRAPRPAAVSREKRMKRPSMAARGTNGWRQDRLSLDRARLSPSTR